jgi:hypothetical protein
VSLCGFVSCYISQKKNWADLKGDDAAIPKIPASKKVDDRGGDEADRNGQHERDHDSACHGCLSCGYYKCRS